MLALLLVIPLLSALALALAPRLSAGRTRALAAAASALVAALSVPLLVRYETAPGGQLFRRVLDVPWIPAIDLRFHVGIDGIGLLFVALATFVLPLLILSARADERGRGFFAAMLAIQGLAIGLFGARDLLLFYGFWQLLDVGIHALLVRSTPAGSQAPARFLAASLAGSLPLLAAILYLRARVPAGADLFEAVRAAELSSKEQWLCFLGFGLAFGIRLPIMPLQAWFSETQAAAAAPVAALVGGVLVATGGYGFVRFVPPLFPHVVEDASGVLLFIAVLGIVAGALIALVTRDLRRVLAYLTVSQMGIVLAGAFASDARGVAGGLFHAVAHGVSMTGLLLLAGMLERRRIGPGGPSAAGLAARMPLFAGAFLFFVLSLTGTPLLAGFVGELLVVYGLFDRSPIAAIAAMAGLAIGAWAVLAAVRRMFARADAALPTAEPGTAAPSPADAAPIRDLGWLEVGILLPLCLASVLLGARPGPLLEKVEDSVLVAAPERQR